MYESPMGLDRPMHDCEAESAATRLRRNEWVEQLVPHVSRDSRALIYDPNSDCSPSKPVVLRELVTRKLTCFDSDFAGRGRGMNSV